MRQFYTLQTNFEAKKGNIWKETICYYYSADAPNGFGVVSV